MKLKKLISVVASFSMVVSLFSGVIAVKAEDTETVYNFSSLTEASYSKNGASVFDGALTISGGENIKPVAVNTAIVTPLGSTESVTSALIVKKLAVKVHLKAGETVVEYYCGSDSKLSSGKDIDVVVQNSTGASVAAEANSEKSGINPYTISYKAETEGDYTIVDCSTGTNRTVVYAVVVTTADYESSGDVTPSVPPTPTSSSNPNPQSSSATRTTVSGSTASISAQGTTFADKLLLVAAVDERGRLISAQRVGTSSTPTPTPPPPIDPDAVSEISIVREAGWLESAYVMWTNTVDVEKYNVYIRPENGEYTKIDDELVRYYGSYYRADALGLAAGKYQMKVAAVLGGVEKDSKESAVVEVQPHIREGYAFDSHSSHYNKDGVGAYKNDGTLKDGAQIIYITDANKDTVTAKVVTDGKGKETECQGLAAILSAREKGYADSTPLCIRMIGQVESPEGKNSSGYMQIKSTKNVTFEGVGDDACTYHWSFLIRDAKNVEVRNLAVMEFYDDGISLDTNNFNCWVHNCDIFYGQNRGGDQKKGDGSLDVKSGSDYCTFSYNHFWDSGKSSLCGMKDDSYKGYHMTYHHNWFDHSDSRHPRVRGDVVHIYNNYYDGNSKYGVGSTTQSQIFVENNVFRNCLHPVLISLQGTDALSEKGTFSGEVGGMIKMYGNAIYGGIAPIYASETNTNNFDAYLAQSRDEIVPSDYTASTYTYENFDTADTMYDYTPTDTDKVVVNVKTYAGRVEGGDFQHTFVNSKDDASYDRDPVLGDALQVYKTTLKTEFVTGNYYQKTDGGEIPAARESVSDLTEADKAEPKPAGTPGGSISSDAEIWRASDTGASVTDGTALKDDWLTLIGGGVTYASSSRTISGVSFSGKMNAPSGQTAPTLAEKGQNGATLKFTPPAKGKIKVYIKLNNAKTFYIINESGSVIAQYENTSGSSAYTTVAADVEAGGVYYAFGDGTNSEYWAAEYEKESEGEYSDSGSDDVSTDNVSVYDVLETAATSSDNTAKYEMPSGTAKLYVYLWSKSLSPYGTAETVNVK